jgi:hypothetical protein
MNANTSTELTTRLTRSTTVRSIRRMIIGSSRWAGQERAS